MSDLETCSVSECGNPASTRGYCRSHYQKLRRSKSLPAKNRAGPNHCGKEQCPAAKKIYTHIYYLQNAEERRRKNKEWRTANPELNRHLIAEWNFTNSWRVRQSAAKWRSANPERARQLGAEWRAANPERATSHRAARRAALKNAMPAWLGSDHIVQINAIYAEAKRLERETGTPHEVDHIVPLAADKNVCGLHVPWNLRAIPWIENRSRSRVCGDGAY